jgi:PAS domain S-box-containing protein
MKEQKKGRLIASYGKFFLFTALVLLAVAALIYTTYRGVRQELIGQLNARQLIHAKQAAKGIEAFFQDHIAVLGQMARDGHIIDLDATGRQKMRTFLGLHANTVRILSRIDKRGRILHTEPRNPEAIGKTSPSIATFHEARRTGRPSVSDVFTNLRGFKVIIVHVPVFKNGAFHGAMAMQFPFDLIAGRYVEDIRIGEDGYAWVISRDGVEISCPVPGHTGKSVLDNCRDFPDILAMANRMMQGEQGVTTYQFDRIRGSTVQRMTKQAVFMPIRLANNFWSIVVATPEEEVMTVLEEFRNKLLVIGLLLTVFMGFFFYLLFRNLILSEEIHRRRKTEAALQAKTEELDRYFTHSLDLLCIADTDGYFRRLNPEWERTLGYSLAELQGKRFLDLIHPDDVEPTRAAVGELADAKEVLGFVNRYRCRDGSYRWIEWRSYPVDNLIYAVARDITARKNMEEALRESESRLKSIFLAAPVGIGVVSNRMIKQANDRLCAMTGYSREELIDQSARIFYATDEEFEFAGMEKYAQILQWGTGTVETRWIRKDGILTDILLSSTPIDPSDLAAGVTFTALDITERKQAETALRKSEQQYRLIAENSTDVIWTMDLDGRFTYVSPSVTMHSGYTPEEAMAIPLDTNLHEEDLPRVLQEIAQELQKPREQRAERRILEIRQNRKDGSVLDVEVSVAWLYDERGEIIGLQGSTRDISARKQAEAAQRKLEAKLQQAQKMESIGALAGGIAHDFNNLLMGIQGYASLMLLDIDTDHPLHEKLRAIEKQVRSGADLTGQLLGFARGGRNEVRPTDVNELLASASALFGRTKKEIHISEKYGEGLWTVEADRGQMDQVLLNLFVNAWQAMPGGGDLFLETGNVHLDAAYAAPYEIKPGPYVKISITDTGVGMDEKTRRRIFDPFFTTQEMGRGTGLGLASAYGIITGHGGFINVYSEKGHGTTFNIYLPASSREAVREAPSAGAIRRGHETVLVVDDEPMILDVTREMLEGLGYRVLVAPGGVEALEIYRADHGRIALVILDMIMPGMGGGELLDRLKDIRADCRVILSSGYSINGEAKAIVARGARIFLQKPFRLDDLSRKVREALEEPPNPQP